MARYPARLSDHFLAREFIRLQDEPDDTVIRNLFTLATELEFVRRILGDEPITITSGWRTWSHNAAIGGSSTSDHPEGLAADFQHATLSPGLVSERLLQAQTRLRFDQVIKYPTHTHLGIGPRMRRQFLLSD